MDTLIYLCRSVVEDDNPGTVSYQDQLARCMTLAKTHGSANPEVLVDWGKSGGEGLEHRRDGYQQLRDRVGAGGVRWVVSYDLSRLSRSTRETLDLIDYAGKHGTSVHVGDVGILDRADPVGYFTVTALSGANNLLRDMASKRAKETMEKRRADGLPIGRPPYGARPDEDVAAVLAAYDRAGSYNGAARLLNERKVPTRMGKAQGWQGKSVYQVVHRERPVDLTARPRTRSRGRYMTSGLLRCPCGQTMRVVARPWGPQAFCGRAMGDKSHSRPFNVSERRLMPWIRAEAEREYAAIREREGDTIPRDAANEAERARLLVMRDRIIDQYTDGTIQTKPERDRRLAKVDADLEAIAVETTLTALPPIDWSWDAGDVNAILRAMFDYIQLGPDLMPTRAESRLP